MEISFNIYLQDSKYHKEQIAMLLNDVDFEIVLGSPNEWKSNFETQKGDLHYHLVNHKHFDFTADSGSYAQKYFGLDFVYPIIGFYPYHQRLSYSFEINNYEDIDFEEIFRKFIKLIHLFPENLIFTLRLSINYEFIVLTKTDKSYYFFEEEDYKSYGNSESYSHLVRYFFNAVKIFKKEFFV